MNHPLTTSNQKMVAHLKSSVLSNLASGVPDLKLDLLPPQLNGLDLEVNPNSGDESCVEGIFREPEVGYSMLAKSKFCIRSPRTLNCF